MPIYEYRCESCGHQLEKLQRMSDPLLKQCPSCGKRKLRRLVSAAGFRLKGGGWYETDFKRGNKRNLADGDGGGKADAGASSKADAAPKSGDASPAKAAKKESGASNAA